MIMKRVNISESQNVEYKESWRDEYLKWVCGFANASGGKIYIGVNDDLEIIGVDNSKRLLEDIPNKVTTNLGLVADVNLLHSGSLDYIEIVVEPSNIPVAYHGIYHYRSGSTKQELRGAALQQFVLKKMGHSWDDIPHETATLEAIDRESLDYFLHKGIYSKRILPEAEDDSTEKVLDNLGLLTDNGKLKNAAILLFGKCPQRYFPGVQFRIGRFGISESDLIIQDSIEGNIIQMADKVIDVLKSKYLTSPVRYEGIVRVEPLEIPEDALREILYNAICHKDYTGVHIQMKVYDEQVSIWNEGTLPEGYTIETLMGEHSSKPRNQNIANVFFKAGFIEAWGRGFKKIQESFIAANLEMPTFDMVHGGMMVTIKRPNARPTINRPSTDYQPTINRPSTEQVCVLVSLMSEVFLPLTDLMDIVGLKHRPTFRTGYLLPAIQEGYVERKYPNEPRRRGQKYRLTELGVKIKELLALEK